jgi:MurNAc alpha-1-phosphate uridylyltransferase
MIFAAGLGKRLYPLTDNLPKPLVTVAGKPLLYYALDLATKFNFKKIIINCHYFHSKIEEAVELYRDKLESNIELTTIHEPIILETGGAIKNASRFFADSETIFTLNSDSVISSSASVWQGMIERWNPLTMDFMMLITPVNRSFGSIGKGDFDINQDGSLHTQNELKNFMFSGLQILKTGLIRQNPNNVFSLAPYYKNEEYKLFGYVNEGHFYHVSNIKDYEKINAMKII